MESSKPNNSQVKQSISASSITSLVTCSTVNEKKYARIDPNIRNSFLEEIIFRQLKIKDVFIQLFIQKIFKLGCLKIQYQLFISKNYFTLAQEKNLKEKQCE
eukprot:TRINITY_DN29421_c0_g1_i1.p4 TRINITY_DN29421_c0_g1~~TRINITY_DN29421_c0_g1_i1.p4  ORF type:complete len:102 (+),score=8.35 TRINITY_DN29421_c0_g1_i1:195-500(+)